MHSVQGNVAFLQRSPVCNQVDLEVCRENCVCLHGLVFAMCVYIYACIYIRACMLVCIIGVFVWDVHTWRYGFRCVHVMV